MPNKLSRLRWIHRAWRYRILTEKPEIKFLLQHLKPGQTAVDIGAHKGAYTYWMYRRVGATGKVFAFEPQPQLYGRLKDLFSNIIHGNIHLDDRALSSSSLETVMSGSVHAPTPSASLTPEHSQNGETIPVSTTTLDSVFMAETPVPVHFIKCDVEGHELDVLKGGINLLQRFQPILSIECEARHKSVNHVEDVFRFLGTLNYSGTFFDGHDFCSLETFNLERYQLNPNRDIYVNNFFFKPNGLRK